MKIIPVTALILASLFGLATAFAAPKTPTEIGGFKLGDSISDYSDIEYSDYLKEVVVNDWYGFRKGIISYGTCANPGQIVNIRMKYEDPSKLFYDELLKRYKAKYGKPDEWNGDAFGVVYIWRWRFVDENNRRVNLLLQHNLQNHKETVGNMVKLSYPELIEEERLCFIEFCQTNKTAEQRETIKQRMKPDWDFMIPR
jgi:hypothetical protein